MAERPAEDKSGILPETSIFFYGIPAYGHLHSNLYLTGCLSAAGYRVVYYSMEPYRREIEANGCEFRAYPLDRDSRSRRYSFNGLSPSEASMESRSKA